MQRRRRRRGGRYGKILTRPTLAIMDANVQQLSAQDLISSLEASGGKGRGGGGGDKEEIEKEEGWEEVVLLLEGWRTGSKSRR